MIASTTYNIAILIAAVIAAAIVACIGYGGGVTFIVTQIVNLLFNNIITPLLNNIVITGEIVIIRKQEYDELIDIKKAVTLQQAIDALSHLH
jgi:hypothetical protein